MPPVQDLQFKLVTRVLQLADRASGGMAATTLTANHAKGATTLNVGATAGIANGKAVRVGAGETMSTYVVSSFTATTLVIASPGLKRAYASGEPVAEMTVDRYGPPTDGSTVVRVNRESENVQSAEQRLVFAVRRGYGAIRAELTLAALTIRSLALGLGIPKSKILGAGTTADPLQIVANGADFGTSRNTALVIEGTIENDTSVRAELYGCRYDYTGISLQLARTQLSSVPVKVLGGAGGVFSDAASPYTVDNDYSMSQGDVLDGLTDFGTFAAATTGPLSSTLTAQVAAGANVWPFAAVTNLVAGDWFAVSAGNTIEYHMVESISVLNVTTKTRALRTHASGTAVVRQAKTTESSLSEEGVSLAIGGQVTEQRSALSDMAIGTRPGNADATVSYALTAFTLARIAQALGLAVPGGNVLEVFSGLGNTAVGGIFCTGTMQGGQTIVLVTWSNAMQVDVSVPFSTTGAAPSFAVSTKPTSGFVIFAY